MKSKLNQTKGFSLTQVMIAIAIVGILVAVSYPIYSDYVTRSRISEGFAFADEARERVQLALVEGSALPSAYDLFQSNGGQPVDMMTGLTWYETDNVNHSGYIIAEMNLPGLGKKKVFALVYDAALNHWHCQSVLEKPASITVNALNSKYLSAICRNKSQMTSIQSSVAKQPGSTSQVSCPPPNSPAFTVKLSHGGRDICAEPCASGQKRDTADPLNCVATTSTSAKPDPDAYCKVNPNEEVCQVGSPAYCKAKPNTEVCLKGSPAYCKAKPSATECQSSMCAVCVGPPQLCEKLYKVEECQYPNHFCITHIENSDTGRRTVKRSCGNYNEMYSEWFMATSDEDLCQTFDPGAILTLDFECTFACQGNHCGTELHFGGQQNWYRPD